MKNNQDDHAQNSNGKSSQVWDYNTSGTGSDLFRELFNCLPEGECIIEASGTNALPIVYHVVDINPAGLRLVNMEYSAAVGRALDKLLGIDANAVSTIIHDAQQEQTGSHGVTIHTGIKTGGTFSLRAFKLAEGRFGVLFDDVTAQEAARHNSSESERLYREITDNLTDVVWRGDLKQHITYISPSIKRLTGMPAEEYRNRPFTDMFPPDAIKAIKAAVEEELKAETDPSAPKDRSRQMEVRHRLPNGNVEWLSLNITLLRSADGIVSGVQGIARSITEQKSAEALLRESEDSHRLLFMSMVQGVVYRAADGTILSVNPALLSITGFEQDELVGKRSFPERWAHIREDGTTFPDGEFPCSIALRTGKPYGPEVMGGIHGKTGKRVWLSLNAIPVFCGGETTPSKIYTIFEDITARKHAEQELHQSNELMRFIIEHSRSSIAVLDRDLKYLYISRQFMADWLKTEKNVIGHSHFDLNPTMPERWKNVDRRALAGEVLSSDEDLSVDSMGNPLWIRWDCRPWYKRDGSIGGIILYTEDITKRKSMEEALKLSEEKYRIIAENVTDVIWLFNINRDRFTFISPSVARMTSFTADEILASGGGKARQDDPFPLQADRVAAAAQALVDSPASSKTLLFESRRVFENRPVLWTEDAMTARYNAAGEIEIFGVSRDISARKENEENLRYMSYHDQLTGLFNRRFFEEELERLDTPRRYPLSIIMGDVNGLKIVNDSFGHKAGDELLVKGSEVFRKACRADDIIARLGGDEFVIVLPETTLEKAEQIIARIKCLATEIKVSDMDLSISFGCGTKDNSSQSIREVMADVENQMYRHKLYERISMRSTAVDAIMNALFQKSNRELLHSKRVSELCRILACRIGFDKEDVNRIGMAGVLHDIGKIGVDEKILNKHGRLTNEEWPEIRRHPEIGWRILSATMEFHELARFILEHQENWDGSGYPKGLRHEEISREARIIRIADSYDAMTHSRAFQDALSHERAAEELRRHAGTHYDPDIVDALLKESLPVSAE